MRCTYHEMREWERAQVDDGGAPAMVAAETVGEIKQDGSGTDSLWNQRKEKSMWEKQTGSAKAMERWTSASEEDWRWLG